MIKRSEYGIAYTNATCMGCTMRLALRLEAEELLFETSQQIALQLQRDGLIGSLGADMTCGLECESQASCGQVSQDLLGVFDLSVEFVQFPHPSGVDRLCGLCDLLDIAYSSCAAGPEPCLAFRQVRLNGLDLGGQPGVLSFESLQMHPHPLKFINHHFLACLLLPFRLIRQE